jgi:transcription elongation factor Elf1
MLIKLIKLPTVHSRLSKLGVSHDYKRLKTIAVLRCDNCGELFERPMAMLSPKRRSNKYFHVCDKCDVKRFAQRKGAERRTIWDRPVSSSDDISKL